MQPIQLISKRNELAIATHRFEQNMRKVDFGDSWDLRDVMNGLPDIQFREGYTLDGCYVGDLRNASMKLYAYRMDSTKEYVPGKNGGVHLNPKNLFGNLYARIVSGKKNYEEAVRPVPFKDGQVIVGTISFKAFETVPPLNNYLDVDFDEKSIWEAMLLLEEASNYLPHRWHGGYAKGRLIVDGASLVQACDGRLTKDIWEPIIQDERLYPKVEILSEKAALVHYCRWGNWSGLTYIVMKATRKGRSIYFEEDHTERLIEYDCGLRY